MRLLLLAALLPGALARPELLPIGAFVQGATGGAFFNGWAYVAVYAFIMWVVIGSALKRTESMQVILGFLRDTAAALVAALLTTHVARWLFCLPTLLDVEWSSTVYYDTTDPDTLAQLRENDAARACRRPLPFPCAARYVTPFTHTYWAGPGLIFGVMLVIQAAYLFLGKYDDVYHHPGAVGGVLLALGELAIVAAAVHMVLRPAPWSGLASNQHTLKYLIVAAAIFAIPVFYDSVLPGGPLLRGAITAAIYVAAWALFYFYAVYLWADTVFYRRPHHALWFAVIYATPSVLGILAGAAANDISPGDSFHALLAQLAAALASLFVYLLIFLFAYSGYACATNNKYL